MTGYALSVSLGMLTIVLPAGLGAREGLLTIILSVAMPAPAAAAVAIVSRFIVTIIDVARRAGRLALRAHATTSSASVRRRARGGARPADA